jgi:hypothetical protein
MAEYVSGTYIMMCGKNSAGIKEEIEKFYYNEINIGTYFNRYFSYNKLYDRIKMAEIVKEKVLDPYNVYRPVETEINNSDIDFNEGDFTWLKK